MSSAQSGAPYKPTSWLLGGESNIPVDVSVTAVFLVLFIGGAISHMSIYQLNRRRGHKFLLSLFCFGFCMARISTSVLRIASTLKPNNINLTIAASVFVSAGVVVLYVLNLILAQRLVRRHHPFFGWTRMFSFFLRALYILIVVSLIMVIITSVHSFFTLSSTTLSIHRAVQLYGATYFAFVSFLPILIILINFLIPSHSCPDPFGSGQLNIKVIVLLLGSLLLCFGSSYRCGTAYLSPVTRSEPLPTYFGKEAFYIVNFTVEVLVVYIYAFMRIDKRFFVPDGTRGPGSYSAHLAIKNAESGTGPGPDGLSYPRDMTQSLEQLYSKNAVVVQVKNRVGTSTSDGWESKGTCSFSEQH